MAVACYRKACWKVAGFVKLVNGGTKLKHRPKGSRLPNFERLKLSRLRSGPSSGYTWTPQQKKNILF